ncbi:hypothetical protein WM40_12320 [Robbsia andropogonis]|uniref:Type III effector protein n=2 Tax=Robbsia andropogonis TaxID=28092 RepID=A0A0F5JZH3_9BURK|nr:hypothetical protein WM40_12320 [Robbsia andropogonis]
MIPSDLASTSRAHESISAEESDKETTPNPARNNHVEPTRPEISRRNDGFWSNMKRALAPRPVTTTSTIFGSYTQARPTTARAKVGVPQDKRHRPNLDATAPAAVEKHTKKVAQTLAGTRKTASVPQTIAAHGGVDAFPMERLNLQGLEGLDHQAPDIVQALRERLEPPGNADETARMVSAAKQELVLHRLHQAFGTNTEAARAAITQLDAAGALLDIRGEGFELARRLTSSSLGHETLRTLCGEAATDSDPVSHAVRNDATKLALRASNALIDALPAGHPVPDNMAAMVQLALSALPEHERPAGTTGTPEPLTMQSDVSVPAKALLAAVQLAADPSANPEAHLKSAYLAWRCGFKHEGPGTPLAHTQHRLFKLSRYAKRASQPGTLATLRRMFGFNKSPMSALAFGVAGASLRQPEDDLQKADVIWQLGAALERSAATPRTGPLAPQITNAVRAATLQVWYERVAKKGWRDTTAVPKRMRQTIASRAAAMLNISETEIKLSQAYAMLKTSNGARLTTATLENWIEQLEATQPEEAELATRLKGALQQLVTLEKNGEMPLDTATPQTVLDNFKRVITEPRMTYDVRLSDGGQFGVNTSIVEALKLPVVSKVPLALVGPDAKLIHGRHAMINAGSSANHGQLFVGSDRRWAAHLGVSGAAGANLLHSNLQMTGTVQLLPGVLDISQPKGVMVRARLQPTGTPPAGQQPAGEPDPWRKKLVDVIDAATASGPNKQLPRDAGAMWDAVAHAFYKDPDVSFNWMDSKAQSVSSSVNLTTAARYEHHNYKIGPYAQIGVSKTWATRVRRREEGPLKADFATRSSALQVPVSAGLIAAAPPQGNFSDENGHVKSVVLPSVGIVGVGTTVFQSETGSTWRIAEEDGHIDASLSYRDTTFTNVGQFKRYVDSQRTAWDRAYREQPTGAAQPEPIDEYLARVDHDATRGNQLYAERVWLRPDAAAKINALRELRDAIVPPGHAPDATQRAGIDARNAQIATLLSAEESWDKRFLYSLETNGTSRALGPGFMATVQRITEVSHPRQLTVLRVERPVSPPTDDA